MAIIERNPEVMWREEDEALAGAQQALDRGEDVAEIGTAVLFSGGTMLSINLLGTQIWETCDGASVEQIVQELLEEFDVEEAVLREDVVSFLEELKAKGFIRYVD